MHTDNHPLYGTFLSQLSSAIFEWCEEDVAKLRTAKRAEMEMVDKIRPSESAVDSRITKTEMALHCRRRTRGVEETRQRIQDLLEKMWHMTDSLGVPLIDQARMARIWETQQQHLGCIQDPAELSLYTITGSIQKGGQTLKTYRCGRGSVSLESIHLHQNRFVPGKTTLCYNWIYCFCSTPRVIHNSTGRKIVCRCRCTGKAAYFIKH